MYIYSYIKLNLDIFATKTFSKVFGLPPSGRPYFMAKSQVGDITSTMRWSSS